MDAIRYPAMPQREPLTGSEEITLDGHALATMLDFWRWAYSDVNDNASRGRLAEYIVRTALNCTGGTRREWDPYDILWEEIKIEVKSSAYIQTWAQRGLSRISFGIRPTRYWDPVTGVEDPVLRRQADVYVFCIESCREQRDGNPNPLDLAQWEFRVLATSVLDGLGDQKTISLAGLDRLGAARVPDAFDLPEAVRRAAHVGDTHQPRN